MGRIERFEDLDVWQRSRDLTRQVYAASGDGEFARDFGLKDQMRRASVSIMSNIAEGFERGSNKEFIQFLYIAKGSAGNFERNSMLHSTKDTSPRILSQTWERQPPRSVECSPDSFHTCHDQT